RQSGALKTQSRVLPTAKNIACYIYPGRHAFVNMATPPTRLSHFGMLSAPGGAGHVRTPPVRPGAKRLSKAPNPCCNRTRRIVCKPKETFVFDSSRSTGHLVSRAQRRFANEADRRLKPLGLSAGYIPVILSLAAEPLLSQKALVQRAAIEQPTMAGTLR